MTEPLKVLKGVNGQVELYTDKVIIKRKGALAKMTQGFFQGDKTIYLHQITGIKIKRAGLLTNGFIQFVLAGNIETKRGLMKQTQDENTVMFGRGFSSVDPNELVEEIKETIENTLQSKNSSNVNSTADEIAKYKKLLEDGVITEDEFSLKKKQLLNL